MIEPPLPAGPPVHSAKAMFAPKHGAGHIDIEDTVIFLNLKLGQIIHWHDGRIVDDPVQATQFFNRGRDSGLPLRLICNIMFQEMSGRTSDVALQQ